MQHCMRSVKVPALVSQGSWREASASYIDFHLNLGPLQDKAALPCSLCHPLAGRSALSIQ